MTDNDKDDSRDDVDWLKDAFDRALQGDNGTAPDAARPAVNPFAGLAPTGDTAPIEPAIPAEPGVPTEMPSQRHDLDLDFETDNMPPVGAFEPVVPLDRPLPSVATDYPRPRLLMRLTFRRPLSRSYRPFRPRSRRQPPLCLTRPRGLTVSTRCSLLLIPPPRPFRL